MASSSPSAASETPTSFFNIGGYFEPWAMPASGPLTLTYKFVQKPAEITYALDSDVGVGKAFGADQQALALSAMNAFSNVTNIKFAQSKGEAIINWVNQTGDVHGSFANFPGATPDAGDIWIGTSISTVKATPADGSETYTTYMHELGHALSMSHPHEWEAPMEFNDQKLTLMSYNRGADFNPTSLMVDDIAAIQSVYGKNMSYRTGNDVYKWDADKSVFEAIWDAGGIDTIDAGNQKAGVAIDLTPGHYSSIGKSFQRTWSGGSEEEGFWEKTEMVHGYLGVAYDTTIENATGSAHDDVLTGNSIGNVLTGGAGADTLRGGAGADTLIGGIGNDRYAFSRGDGSDTIVDTDKTKGNRDVIAFENGVDHDQLWFRKSKNDLEISVIGTQDRLLVKDWYKSADSRIESIVSADGYDLVSAQLDRLVSAMSAFAPPGAGELDLSSSYLKKLEPVIAAAWSSTGA